jgi:hypothetical protein
MSNILSFENVYQNNLSSPSQLFLFGNQVYQLIYDSIPTKKISIKLIDSLNSFVLYESSTHLYIEKIKINPFTSELLICGFLPETKTGFYAISTFNGSIFQKFTIYPITNVEKVDEIIFIDNLNFLLLTSTVNNQFWILHPKYKNIVEISSLNGKSFNIRDAIFSNTIDQLDIYVEVLGSDFLKSIQLFRFNGSDILSSFISN